VGLRQDNRNVNNHVSNC